MNGLSGKLVEFVFNFNMSLCISHTQLTSDNFQIGLGGSTFCIIQILILVIIWKWYIDKQNAKGGKNINLWRFLQFFEN
jgi:hypothetical protein